MTTKTIPAQVITTCDWCQIACKPSNRTLGGSLRLTMAGLDLSGAPVASNDFVLSDLCDRCTGAIRELLQQRLDSRKAQ